MKINRIAITPIENHMIILVDELPNAERRYIGETDMMFEGKRVKKDLYQLIDTLLYTLDEEYVGAIDKRNNYIQTSILTMDGTHIMSKLYEAYFTTEEMLARDEYYKGLYISSDFSKYLITTKNWCTLTNDVMKAKPVNQEIDLLDYYMHMNK